MSGRLQPLGLVVLDEQEAKRCRWARYLRAVRSATFVSSARKAGNGLSDETDRPCERANERVREGRRASQCTRIHRLRHQRVEKPWVGVSQALGRSTGLTTTPSSASAAEADA